MGIGPQLLTGYPIIALIVLNNASVARQFTIAWHGKRFTSALPPGALATYLWR